MKTITINTGHGPAAAQVVDHAEYTQYNCFLPPTGGAGVFMLVSPALPQQQAHDILADIINHGPHDEDLDLTHLSHHIIAAGSVNMAQINVSKTIRNAQEKNQ